MKDEHVDMCFCIRFFMSGSDMITTRRQMLLWHERTEVSKFRPIWEHLASSKVKTSSIHLAMRATKWQHSGKTTGQKNML
jgi:NADH:ubiquinone oxidoreductase subunit